MWIVYALLSALFASLTALFAKIGVKDVNPNLATAIRTVVVLILIWGIVFARGEQEGISLITKRNLTFLILSGLMTGLSWLFYFKALHDGPLSVIAPIDKLSIALTILLAFIFLNEPVTIKTLAGALLIISGVVVLII
ncbi:MAG TPA: EamA family transporter [Ignavibacteria bacterium]|nr:EamA family transporter [Ignavibacteria bacterium]HMR41445.1 EamA family transporter [Ignavibacteria bacterium]